MPRIGDSNKSKRSSKKDGGKKDGAQGQTKSSGTILNKRSEPEGRSPGMG
jgi:hypothetical protein